MVSDSERTKILEMIEDGSITAEEGLTLLNALDASSEPVPHLETEYTIETPVSEGDDPLLASSQEFTGTSNADPTAEAYEGEVEIVPPGPEPPSTEEIDKWKRWWVIPLWVGAGITAIGGGLMYWAFRASGFGFWFACAWFPFLLGVILLALAWSSRTSPWLHVRVHQAPGKSPKKIAISFPIPVRLTVWGLKLFGHHIPHLENTSLDEVILALKDVSTDETPLFVDVNEGDDGERVQVFIG
jgi:hypothetical protein